MHHSMPLFGNFLVVTPGVEPCEAASRVDDLVPANDRVSPHNFGSEAMKDWISSLGQTMFVLVILTLCGMGVIAARSWERESSLALFRQHIIHCAACRSEGVTPESLADFRGHGPSRARRPDPPREAAVPATDAGPASLRHQPTNPVDPDRCPSMSELAL
jgi:hypothetical protein